MEFPTVLHCPKCSYVWLAEYHADPAIGGFIENPTSECPKCKTVVEVKSCE